MSDMDAIVKEFLVESRENLDLFERDLVGLERNPTARDTLDSAFRTIHSIKGGTGFLGLSALGAVAHAGESLLSHMRDGRLVITAEIASVLLTMVDSLRQMLSNIERTGTEGETDHATLVERLMALQHLEQASNVPSAASTDQGANGSIAAPDPLLERASRSSTHARGRVRVDVEQLDVLMNLAGELVLTRNEMLQYSSVQQNPVLLSTSQRLNVITTQLQEEIMKTRMQPIDNVWNKFPRLVRDTALRCGKTVRLEMEGNETELDKTLIEAIKDPLTHLVRNCVDHGLETPDRRVAAGKTPDGCVLLRAFHEGSQVNIEVSDDGGGIDVATIKHSAVERELITPEQAAAMGDQDALTLIFLPGFSTAKTVTNISGRGVGMDVVKTNIENIGGKVSVHSQLGLGTTLKIRIPLTLAIMPALIVTSGQDRYAIPQVSVLELLRFEGSDVDRNIQTMGDAAVCRLRGGLLPLVRLDAELGTAGPFVGTGRRRSDVANVVVLQADDRTYGLVVDDVTDTQEIVVKPLGSCLRGITTFMGATIMGDGRVVLILDVVGLAVHAKVLSESRKGTAPTADAPVQASSDKSEAFLAVAGDDDTRLAIRLSQVMRLEEFMRSSLEHIGDQDVVQYRGEILPIVNICGLLPERRQRPRWVSADRGPGATIQTVVYSKDGCRLGLAVNRILDTIELSLVNLRPGTRKGVVASTVIHGRVTEILDLDVICAGLMTVSSSEPALERVAV